MTMAKGSATFIPRKRHIVMELEARGMPKTIETGEIVNGVERARDSNKNAATLGMKKKAMSITEMNNKSLLVFPVFGLSGSMCSR